MHFCFNRNKMHKIKLPQILESCSSSSTFYSLLFMDPMNYDQSGKQAMAHQRRFQQGGQGPAIPQSSFGMSPAPEMAHEFNPMPASNWGSQVGMGNGYGSSSDQGSGMAFMSFDLANSSGKFSPPNIGIGTGNFGQASFEDEPPLLEELGINIQQIIHKTFSMLNPIKFNVQMHEEEDLSGPIMFCILFGLFQLLNGKVHFGIILGWSFLSSAFLYSIFNLLIPIQIKSSLELYKACSIVGYSLLPIILFSSISLFIPKKSMVILFLAIFFVFWSTKNCSKILLHIFPNLNEQKYLVIYACALIFTTFSLLVLF